jgi:hypothetical protein
MSITWNAVSASITIEKEWTNKRRKDRFKNNLIYLAHLSMPCLLKENSDA